MSEAWLLFNSINGELLEISWNKPDDNKSYISISKEIAGDFILGKNKLHDYIISSDELQRRPILKTIPISFWTLQELTGKNSDIDIGIYNNQIFVSGTIDKQTITIFATLKNNPSWLITSWILNVNRCDKMMKFESGMFKISFKDAINYSYYIGKTE